jgi:hypothetical protein
MNEHYLFHMCSATINFTSTPHGCESAKQRQALRSGQFAELRQRLRFRWGYPATEAVQIFETSIISCFYIRHTQFRDRVMTRQNRIPLMAEMAARLPDERVRHQW